MRSGTAGQAMLRLVVDDPNLLFDEYKDKGVFHEHTQLDDTEWGTREFAAESFSNWNWRWSSTLPRRKPTYCGSSSES